MMEKYKILIVEDDVDLREGLSFSFSGDGYDDFEHKIDELLSYLSYICYLKKERNISKKEFRILQYEINRTCTSPCIQAYLWNLYHFSQKQGSECSFQYLIDYGIKNKLIDKSFLKPDCKLYEKTLNF